MVADSDHPSSPARSLADRLRDLREREYGAFTQTQLARVLGGPGRKLSNATISQWENPDSGRLPPPQRLATYARLFCTARSFASGAPRLLRDDELTEQEREREAELYSELLELRDLAQTADVTPVLLDHRRSIWSFPDQKAISIVCSDAIDPPSYADPGHLNYSRYSRHADLDALVEVFGQLRADNPHSFIRILPAKSLELDFALNHVVIIGGAASRDTERWFAQDIPLPTAQEVTQEVGKTHIFKCTVEGETREFSSLRHDGALIQDVGLIARGPHPNIPGRTVTVLGGITSRGVHGAALCFTDPHVRDTNEQYIEDAFGNAEAFCILVNIPVRNNSALPPNLWRDNIRLYEWSTQTGAHW
jgi:transcriptional regulator with XRE-family HTH domain